MRKILLQKNIWQEHSYDQFVNDLISHGFECVERHVVPFTMEFDVPLAHDWIPDYVFGSGRFVNICRERGYPTFMSFAPVEFHYPDDRWINIGKTVKWGDIKIDHPVFLKPYTEKFFTGRIVESQEDLEKVQLATSFIENENDELILVSDPVQIQEEIRYFVIGNTVITGSGYKVKGNARHYRVDSSHPSWQAVKYLLGGSYIDKGFVIDVGLVNGEWKIVELNNMNSAGIYECDTAAIANALKHL